MHSSTSSASSISSTSSTSSGASGSSIASGSSGLCLAALALLVAGCFPELPPLEPDALDDAIAADTAPGETDTAAGETDAPASRVPLLLAVAPRPHEVGVSPSVEVHFDFDRPMSVPPEDGIVFYSDVRGFIDGALSVDPGHRVRFRPTQPLHRGERVFATVGPVVTSATGDFIGAPQVTSFHVATPAGTPRFTRTTHREGTGVRLLAGYFDGDDKLDLILLRGLGGAGTYFLSGTEDGFATSVAIDTELTVTAGVVADFDGDGHLDVALTAFGANGRLLLGRGDGRFVQAEGSLPFQSGVAIAAADLDADGDIDLVLLTATHATLLHNNGDGSFSMGSRLPVEPEASGLVVDDLNGDGLPDIAVTHTMCCSGPGLLRLYLTSSLGYAQVDLDIGQGSKGLVSGDFNGDGWADLAVLQGVDQSVGIMLNDGAGGFGAPITYATGSPGDAIATGDLTGDGRLDLVVANSVAHTADDVRGYLRFMTNRGNGVFQLTETIETRSGPSLDVILADIDGDGDLDALVVGPSGITIHDNEAVDR